MTSSLGLFDSDWHRGLRQLAEREWPAGAPQAATAGDDDALAERAWAAVTAAEFVGAAVPSELDGSGLGLGPVLDIAAAAGAVLFPTRLAFEALYPALVLTSLAQHPMAAELLTGIAGGRRVAVAAGSGETFVHGLPSAAACLVLRADPPAVLRTDGAAMGAVTSLHLLDGRELALVDLAGITGELLAEGDEADRVLEAARWVGALLAAADGLGAAAAALERAVTYAGQRRQFGRPIGSFQAVKHALVDRFLDLQVGRALLASAAEGDIVDPDTAAMAKAWINGASVRAVDTAIQVHGAVGFTAELGLHLHQRRALVDRELFAGTGAALAIVRRALGIGHQADPERQAARTGAPR